MGENRRHCVLLPVANPHRAAGLATLAARLAAAYGAPVVLLYIERQGELSRPLPEEPEDPRSWPALNVALGTLAHAGIAAGWIVRLADNVGLAIRQTAHELQARYVVLGWRGRIVTDSQRINATLADVLEDPFSDIIVLGGEPPTRLQRILVPLGSGPHARLALELALMLSASGSRPEREAVGQVTVLHVVPDRGTGITGRTLRRLRRYLGRHARDDHLRSKIVSASDTAQAILDELEGGYDAVLMGTSRESLIDRLLFGDVPQRVAEESNVSVLVVRRHANVLLRTERNAWQALFDALPTLTAEEQASVHETIREGSRSRADFFVMTGLSAVLAALGLLLNSPAAIIGAMLVAPLMSAIVGMGLGVVEGDTALLRDAALSALRGMLLAVCVGLVVGWLVPTAGATPEIMSRTRPNVLDLGVALASGAAGAYAICRKEVSAALAGVAIAAALVPPLATIGIGIALGSRLIAGGALLLYVTNLIAIAAAGGLVFLLLGFAPPETQKEKRNVLRRGFSGVAILLVAITLLLGWVTTTSIRTAQTNQAVERAVREQIAALPDTELEGLDSSWREDGMLQIEVTVRSSRQLSHSTAMAIQRGVAAALQRPVALLLTVIPTARLDPMAPPVLTPTPTAARAATPVPTASLVPSKTRDVTDRVIGVETRAFPATTGAERTTAPADVDEQQERLGP